MAPETARRILWLVFVVALPLPFTGVQAGLGPALRMLFLGVLALAVYLPNPDYMSLLLAGLMLGQGLVYTLVLYGVARLVTRFARRAGSESVSSGLVAAFTLVVLRQSLLDVYLLPLSSTGRANLFGSID